MKMFNSEKLKCTSIEYLVANEDNQIEYDDIIFTNQHEAFAKAKEFAKKYGRNVHMTEKSWTKAMGLMFRSVWVKPDGSFVKA